MIKNLEISFIDALEGVDSLFIYLNNNGLLLSEENNISDAFERISIKLGDDYWIWFDGYAGINFKEYSREIRIYLYPSCREETILHQLLNHWLPYIYQVWGMQVLHGSSTYNKLDGRICTFVGPTGAGKSTTAYALGQKNRWAELVDDSTAFSVHDGNITVEEIPSIIRLRPKSAEYFQEKPYSNEPITWPDRSLTLGKIYFLEPADNITQPKILKLRKSLAYRALLMNAYIYSKHLKELNQKLMLDFLELASQIPISKIVFPKDFSCLQLLIDKITEDFGTE